MKTGTKIAIGVGAAAIVGGAVYGGVQLLKAIDKVNIVAEETYGFNIQGSSITFKQNLMFYNPNDKSIKVRLNDIQAFYENSNIGFLQPAVRDFVIPANGSYKLTGLVITLPKVSLGTALVNLIVNLLNKQDVRSLVDKAKEAATKVRVVIFGKVNNHKFEDTIYLAEKKPVPTGVKGLGVVALHQRNIKGGNRFKKWFPTIDATDKIVNPNGSVEDTVSLMIEMVKKYKGDTIPLSKLLADKSTFKTANNIWTWVYTHIAYKPDTPGVEQLRRPARSYHDRHHGVDCDCYSIFVGSILYNLGIPFKFRITKYDHKTYYQHVYVVIPTANNKEIIIDDVLDTFNYEKPYTQKKDSAIIKK